jgi:hypothetical protein
MKECIICFRNCGELSMIHTPCQHQFCITCILKCAEINNKCPLCLKIIDNNFFIKCVINSKKILHDCESGYILRSKTKTERMILYRNFTSFLLNLFDKTDELLYVRKDLAHIIYKTFFDNYNLILMVMKKGIHTRLLFQTAISKLFSMTYIDGWDGGKYWIYRLLEKCSLENYDMINNQIIQIKKIIGNSKGKKKETSFKKYSINIANILLKK